VIPATCTSHSGARGYTDLVVTKRGGHLELALRVTGQCVIMLDEDSARILVGVRGDCPLQRRGWRSQRHVIPGRPPVEHVPIPGRPFPAAGRSHDSNCSAGSSPGRADDQRGRNS
jgi:hypothetical protein